MQPSESQFKTFTDKVKDYLSLIRQNNLALFTILLLLAAIAATVYLTQNKQLLKIKAAGENSSIDLAIGSNNTFTAELNQVFEVPVMVNTDNSLIVAADIVLTFDKSYLELVDIIKKAEGTPFNKFLPKDSSDNFDKNQVLQKALKDGRIEFGSLSYTGNNNPLEFNGLLGPSNPLVVLKFKALKEGSSEISVQLGSGADESNLVAKSSRDILGKATNLKVETSEVRSQISDSKTATLTSFTSGYAIKNWGHNETTTELRVGGDYDLGFQFKLPVPAQSEIISAKLSVFLKMTSDNSGAIANIKAEKTLNSLELQGENPFIPARGYFNNFINWPLPNSVWDAQTTSPEISNLIQEIVNQQGWQEDGEILLALLKTADTHYANIGKEAKLTVIYKEKALEEKTVTLTVSSDSYTIDGIGNNEGEVKIRAGGKYKANLQFALPLPPGSRILSAFLSTTTDYTEDNLPVNLDLQVEKLGKVAWNIPASSWNQNMNSPDLKNLLQQVTGNSLTITLEGSGAKYVQLYSKEGDLEKALKLIITYK